MGFFFPGGGAFESAGGQKEAIGAGAFAGLAGDSTAEGGKNLCSGAFGHLTGIEPGKGREDLVGKDEVDELVDGLEFFGGDLLEEVEVGFGGEAGILGLKAVVEPFEVAALFPTGDVGGIEARVAEGSESFDDGSVRDVVVEHKVNGFTDVGGKTGHFASTAIVEVLLIVGDGVVRGGGQGGEEGLYGLEERMGLLGLLGFLVRERMVIIYSIHVF